MLILQHAVDQAGNLLLAIPSALTILLTREWFCARMAGDREASPFMNFSIISFASLALNGVSAGGLLRDTAMPLLRLLHGQLWLLILLAIGIVYTALKGPVIDSFSARFAATFLKQAWALFLINWIPLPPFDAAALYFAPFMQWKLFDVLNAGLGLVTLILFSFSFWRVDAITGNFLVHWLKLI
jgi:hypothetical protein